MSKKTTVRKPKEQPETTAISRPSRRKLALVEDVVTQPEPSQEQAVEETLDEIYSPGTAVNDESLPLDELDEELEERIERDARPQLVALEPNVVEPIRDARLLAHSGTNKVTRLDLATLPLPEATDTFQPIPHSLLIDQLEEALAFRHISIVHDEYAVSPDGMKLFGLLELNAEYEGVRFAIGLRNANDKSMRLGMVAGYRVFVCDNMALSGEFKPLLAKHSKHFDLIESVAIGVDRIQRGFTPLREAIEFMRMMPLSNDEARLLIYRAFMENRFPMRIMKLVHWHYFEPQYDEFKSRNVWSISNAFTSAFKELAPVRQYEMTARLGKYLQPFTQAF